MTNPSDRLARALLQDNNWSVCQRRCVYENPWTQLIEEELVHRNGQQGLYGYLAPVDCVMTLPLKISPQGPSVCLVRQWRQAFDCYTWELPCGRMEEGESPEQAGQRELHEETGLQAPHWQRLALWRHSDARVAGHIHALLAWPTEDHPQQGQADPSECDLIREEVSLDQALQAVQQGIICQIASVATLLLGQQWIHRLTQE